jgi:hypothetical protein
MGQVKGGEPGGGVRGWGQAPPLLYTGKVHMRLDDTLSEIWHQLLGSYSAERLMKGENVEKDDGVVAPGASRDLPMMTDDPWSELSHVEGVKMVDLSGLALAHVSLSEVEVEQALQIMWEQVVEESESGQG